MFTALPLTPGAGGEALLKGEIDCACMLTGADAPIVKKLLADERVALASFPRADAYVALYPYLRKLTVPRGVETCEGPPEGGRHAPRVHDEPRRQGGPTPRAPVPPPQAASDIHWGRASSAGPASSRPPSPSTSRSRGTRIPSTSREGPSCSGTCRSGSPSSPSESSSSSSRSRASSIRSSGSSRSFAVGHPAAAVAPLHRAARGRGRNRVRRGRRRGASRSSNEK